MKSIKESIIGKRGISQKVEDKYDTGLVMDEAVVEYVKTVLGGIIGSEYAEPQGRITIR